MDKPYVFRGIELPEHLRESLDAYANNGRPTGGFLQACLENNLAQAVARADDESMVSIPAVMGYVYNEIPSDCWGGPAHVRAWLDRKHAEREAQRV